MDLSLDELMLMRFHKSFGDSEVRTDQPHISNLISSLDMEKYMLAFSKDVT